MNLFCKRTPRPVSDAEIRARLTVLTGRWLSDGDIEAWDDAVTTLLTRAPNLTRQQAIGCVNEITNAVQVARIKDREWRASLDVLETVLRHAVDGYAGVRIPTPTRDGLMGTSEQSVKVVER